MNHGTTLEYIELYFQTNKHSGITVSHHKWFTYISFCTLNSFLTWLKITLYYMYIVEAAHHLTMKCSDLHSGRGDIQLVKINHLVVSIYFLSEWKTLQRNSCAGYRSLVSGVFSSSSICKRNRSIYHGMTPMILKQLSYMVNCWKPFELA